MIKIDWPLHIFLGERQKLPHPIYLSHFYEAFPSVCKHVCPCLCYTKPLTDWSCYFTFVCLPGSGRPADCKSVHFYCFPPVEAQNTLVRAHRPNNILRAAWSFGWQLTTVKLRHIFFFFDIAKSVLTLCNSPLERCCATPCYLCKS